VSAVTGSQVTGSWNNLLGPHWQFPSVRQFGFGFTHLADPRHAPPEQVSSIVQTLPSLQDAVLFVYLHPSGRFVGMHESVVHALPSSQFFAAPPLQDEFEHVSFVVQGLASSQGRVFAVHTHPPAVGSHWSVVQMLPSSQFLAAPPTHFPAEHLSLSVQGFRSSHDTALFL